MVPKESKTVDASKNGVRKLTVAAMFGTALVTAHAPIVMPVQNWIMCGTSSQQMLPIMGNTLPVDTVTVPQSTIMNYNIIGETVVTERSPDYDMSEMEYTVLKDLIASSAQTTEAHIQRLDEKFNFLSNNLVEIKNALGEANNTLNDMNRKMGLLENRLDRIEGTNNGKSDRNFGWKIAVFTAVISILSAIVVSVGTAYFTKLFH